MGVGDRLINTSSKEVYTYKGVNGDYIIVLNSSGEQRDVGLKHFCRYYVAYTDELYKEIVQPKEEEYEGV